MVIILDDHAIFFSETRSVYLRTGSPLCETLSQGNLHDQPADLYAEPALNTRRLESSKDMSYFGPKRHTAHELLSSPDRFFLFL